MLRPKFLLLSLLACAPDEDRTSLESSQSEEPSVVGDLPSNSGDSHQDGDSDQDVDSDNNADTDPQELPCSPIDGVVRLNHLQLRGTHNSYHLKPNPVIAPNHEYSHRPLVEQLGELNVRTLELDVHRDSLWSDELSVYHLRIGVSIDDSSTCPTLRDCLHPMKKWSEQNPCHLPIIIFIEPKDEGGGFPISDPTIIDQTIVDVLERHQLFRPDDLRGSHDSLQDALRTDGWPLLADLRGRFLFVLLDTGKKAEKYTRDFRNLEGRAMFVRASRSRFADPWSAFAKVAATDETEIALAHQNHLIIASNICLAGLSADNCAARLTSALRAGIHLLKDDFPEPGSDRSYWLDFSTSEVALCNPATSGVDCQGSSLEP